MPLIVTDVSAMFVLRITFLIPRGVDLNTSSCWWVGRDEYKG